MSIKIKVTIEDNRSGKSPRKIYPSELVFETQAPGPKGVSNALGRIAEAYDRGNVEPTNDDTKE